MTTFTFPELNSPSPSPPPPEGVYLLNLTHSAEAVAHLTDWFRKPRWSAFASAQADQTQELEQALWDVYQAFSLDTAVGDALDRLGGIVGAVRGSLGDDDYRALIRVRILVNSSDGKLGQLIAICKGLAPSATVLTAEMYPATVLIHVDDLGVTSYRLAAAMLREAKAAGVRLLFSAGFPDMGAVDGSPSGSPMGAVDGSPYGFTMDPGT